MRILHLNSELIFGGGLEKIIVDLLINNKKTKNYLCVINNRWSKEYIEILDKNSVLLCNRKEGTKNPFNNLLTLYKVCKFVRTNNIDIIHCHDTFSLKLAFLIKKILKTKVIFTVHDTYIYKSNLNKFPVDRYIAISKAVYNVINKHISAANIDLIYNGVDIKRYMNETRGSSIDTFKKVSLACVARIVPEKKGQDILIRAMDVLKKKYKYTNFKCNFAGASTRKEMDSIYDLIKFYDLEDNVEFLGNIKNIEELYSNTDIFILPSRYEGFGLVVVEALAAGCHVIVSKLDGPLEIVKENQEYGMYFEKNDYVELANKIYQLIVNNNLRNKYRDYEKTIQYLEKNFSLNQMIQEYNKSYKKCLS